MSFLTINMMEMLSGDKASITVEYNKDTKNVSINIGNRLMIVLPEKIRYDNIGAFDTLRGVLEADRQDIENYLA